MERYLTPPEVAKRLGVSPDAVRGWIRSGELKAINVADLKKSRPRFRVSLEALAQFEKLRQVIPPPPVTRRRRRNTEHEEAKKWFDELRKKYH
jgi:excisionase family DNA binding protein